MGSRPGSSGDGGRLSSREGVPDVAQEPLFLCSCLSRDFSARSALSCSALVRFCCSLSSLTYGRLPLLCMAFGLLALLAGYVTRGFILPLSSIFAP